RDVVGGAAAGFLERKILGLLFRIGGRGGRQFGPLLQLLIGKDRIALAANLFRRLRRSRVEDFQACFRVDTYCRLHSSSSLGSSAVRMVLLAKIEPFWREPFNARCAALS